MKSIFKKEVKTEEIKVEETQPEITNEDIVTGVITTEIPEDVIQEDKPEVKLLPKQLELGNIYSCLKAGYNYEVGTYPLFSVQESILKWNLVRGNFVFDPSKEAELYKEEDDEEKLAIELYEVALTDVDKENAIYERIDALCDKFVVFTGSLAKSGSVEAPLDEQLMEYYQEYITIPNKVKELGYDFLKCINETIKEINSRQQDPIQKAQWEAQGGSNGEKWQKHRSQPEETLYKANYSRLKIRK